MKCLQYQLKNLEGHHQDTAVDNIFNSFSSIWDYKSPRQRFNRHQSALTQSQRQWLNHNMLIHVRIHQHDSQRLNRHQSPLPSIAIRQQRSLPFPSESQVKHISKRTWNILKNYINNIKLLDLNQILSK